MVSRQAIRDAAHWAHFAVLLERARIAADDPETFALRLTPSGNSLAATLARALPQSRSRSARTDRAADLQGAAAHVKDGQTLGDGTAYFLGGDPERAAAALERTPDAGRNAAFWSDLAAAEASAALATGQDERLIEALHAADRALALAPRSATALFNQAITLEAIGLAPVARPQWQRYLAVEGGSPWAAVARRHVAPLSPVDADRWRKLMKEPGALSLAEVERLATNDPQQARGAGEVLLLSSWAEAMAAHDPAAARKWLGLARTLGATLRRTSGESLLAEAVDAIDASPASRDLTEGHVAYRQGRVSFKNGDLIAAERQLRVAERLLARGHSPMATLARFFMACAIHDQNRVVDALGILEPLLASERRQGGTHKALLGLTLHEIALGEGVRGHWSDSLAAATEATAIFRSIGERGSTALAEANLSEVYDFLGQPDLARRHGISALRDACAAGDLFRARVILAALSRTELRGGRWTWARAVIRLEGALASLAPDGRLDADRFQREAAAASHLDAEEAVQALARARASTNLVKDAATRSRLLADIDGVEGAITRTAHPKAAIALLSSAIAFQQTVVRPIMLPRLYLERARAFLSLQTPDDAKRDLDAGIGELERQRDRVRDEEFRPGIFDDASELFHESVALQIDRGADPAKALAYVERGRARTVLEQIEGAEAPPLRTIQEIQRGIGERTALVEFVCLPDRLLTFVVTTRHVVLRIVPISRVDLVQVTDAYVHALSAASPADVSRVMAARLYDIFITPIAAELAPATMLTIVADDVLQRLPFAALFDRRTDSYLIEHVAITTAPSAAVYVAALERERRGHWLPPATALIFANPSVPVDRLRELPPLAGAESEARAIGRRYARSTIFEREEATAERFLSLAPSSDVVHFAGHALIQQNEPAGSALICASSPGLSDDLTVRQIVRMRFRSTQVVVLAACSTMAGRNGAVEGVSSLARAFLVAGVPSVIGTLWDVNDLDAAPLMRTVHDGIARGVSASDAVRIAQIESIRSARAENHNPARWAAIAVMGAGTAGQ
jgi:CHAT domain-containing protein/tetratricopeptide (TPR) repeat protein